MGLFSCADIRLCRYSVVSAVRCVVVYDLGYNRRTPAPLGSECKRSWLRFLCDSRGRQDILEQFGSRSAPKEVCFALSCTSPPKTPGLSTVFHCFQKQFARRCTTTRGDARAPPLTRHKSRDTRILDLARRTSLNQSGTTGKSVGNYSRHPAQAVIPQGSVFDVSRELVSMDSRVQVFKGSSQPELKPTRTQANPCRIVVVDKLSLEAAPPTLPETATSKTDPCGMTACAGRPLVRDDGSCGMTAVVTHGLSGSARLV